MNKMQLKSIAMTLMVLLVFTMTGCSSGIRAIKSRELKVEAKMSDTIFLDAEVLTEEPILFVRVANTSDFQDIDFSDLLRKRLENMGYKITRRAKEATYHIQANLLYMGEAKEGMDPDAILRGGFGGAALGATVAAVTGSNLRGAAGAGLIAGAAVAGGEALVGGIFHIDEYFGLCDVQIKETVEGGVTGTQSAQFKDGTSTSLQTTRSIQSSRQEYRTRIVVKAKQTRMDRVEACNIIADRLAGQISGMFRI